MYSFVTVFTRFLHIVHVEAVLCYHCFISTTDGLETITQLSGPPCFYWVPGEILGGKGGQWILTSSIDSQFYTNKEPALCADERDTFFKTEYM